MACAPFSVFKRTSNDRETGKPVIRYCVRFFDESGAVTRTATLKATSQTRAHAEAKVLFDHGAGIGGDDPLVIDFLADFWKADSDYAKLAALRGRPLSIGYIKITALVHFAFPCAGIA